MSARGVAFWLGAVVGSVSGGTCVGGGSAGPLSDPKGDSLGGGGILPEALGKVMSNGHLWLLGLQVSAQPRLPLQGPAPSRPLSAGLPGCLLAPCRCCILTQVSGQERWPASLPPSLLYSSRRGGVV